MLLPEPKSESETRTRPIVVQKYGGSSVADVEKLGSVADRVVATRRAGYDVVVVVSAMGKTTDALLELAHQACRASASGGTPGAIEPPRRELDMLVSTGERVAMALLSIAIQARGLSAISFTGSQCGIITNDRHFDARIIEVRPHRIEDELARGMVVIVAGYQGMSYKREITTLGRGGSDTTAVALAAALQAERCEIYSDVDGVYSADPRAVPDAHHLPELDYATLQHMAESGAKVLCAQAVEWARRAGVAVYARSSFDPVGGPARETLVRKLGPGEEPRARAVTADRAVVLARFREDAGGRALPAAIEKIARAGLRVVHLRQAGDAVELVLSASAAPDWSETRAELGKLCRELALEEGLGLVSVVGGGMADGPEPLRRLRRALGHAAVEPRLCLASALCASAVVDAARLVEAQRALHAEFVG
ncbi:MAG: aspartate kinase [Deltaproteobacteria bacterium]|nr:aspartate kinase [Deltaproteobacteria bacterium]